MKRSNKSLVAAVVGAALMLVALPVQAVAQPLYQSTRCLRTYQEQVFGSAMQPVVVYTPPETVTLYPGHAVGPVMGWANATLAYVNCVVSGA